jgi:hypothetical protein
MKKDLIYRFTHFIYCLYINSEFLIFNFELTTLYLTQKSYKASFELQNELEYLFDK